MELPPADIEVSDEISQEDIEDIFDTGFGYRISGINPRRDENDQRYILLFANEDGPYNDSVTDGEFEYVGEGLEGDQSKSSPGNSALIDAQNSEVPIHFFYKSKEGSEWKYQGLVSVVDYEFRSQDGREIIVFTMEHRADNKKAEENKTSPLSEKPDFGEEFTAKIDRISNTGNGIIETRGGHINIGPVVSGSKAEEVVAEAVRGHLARCKTDEVKVQNYEERFQDLMSPSSPGKDDDTSDQKEVEEDREDLPTSSGEDAQDRDGTATDSGPQSPDNQSQTQSSGTSNAGGKREDTPSNESDSDTRKKSNSRRERSRNQKEVDTDSEPEIVEVKHDSSETVKKSRVHEEILDVFEDYLRNHGFTTGETVGGGHEADLLSDKDGTVILTEAKVIDSNQKRQIRKGLGQLHEYHYFEIKQKENISQDVVILTLLLSSRPSGDYEEFLRGLQNEGIYTFWVENGELIGFDKSMAKLGSVV